jgi:hypothetical protein
MFKIMHVTRAVAGLAVPFSDLAVAKLDSVAVDDGSALKAADIGCGV